MEGIQIVVFTLNDEVCGVETKQVKEIVKYEVITKMPKMPQFVDGIISLRGTVVPVVNLNKRFGLGNTEITKKTKIIITDLDGKLIGFIVNDVSEIIKLPPESIENTPELIRKIDNSYLKNVGKKGEELISVLDLSMILTDTEIKSLVN
jgi:purine-binding chemotaxis protein CheW